MKKNYVIQDQELFLHHDDSYGYSYRLDTHGSNEEDMIGNAEIAQIDQFGEEIDLMNFYDAPESVQEKVTKAIQKLLADA